MDRPRRTFVGVVLLSCLAAALRYEELAGDPGIYRERMGLLFDGNLPYVDFFYEHLPLMLIPMALAWLLGGAFNDLAYTVIFAGLMALCLLITLVILQRLGHRLARRDAAMSWLGIAGPLFPFVLFRSDPLPVVLAAAALYLLVVDRERQARWFEFAGVVAKGWPVVLGLAEWWRGRRLRAAMLFATTGVLIAGLVWLPGFSEARQFSGIHGETVIGSLFTWARFRSGDSLELIYQAGATYVSVPGWAPTLNLMLGLAVLAVAYGRLRGPFSWDGASRLMGATIVGVLVGAPLLSPQFILWPTPFLALHDNRAVRGLAVAAGALTLLYMLGWNPDFEGDLWWLGALNLRNLVLVGLGFLAAWTVSRGEGVPSRS